LVVWLLFSFSELGSELREIDAMRLGPDLQPLDASPAVLSAAGVTGPPAMAWDGRQYVLAWSTGTAVMAARIAASGAIAPVVQTIAEGRAEAISLTPVSGGTAIIWTQYPSPVANRDPSQ